ncbi:MAG: PDDEXK nuclease domain-containing protein [Methanoregulaceae archaeon]
MKDPYLFDFRALGQDAVERDLEYGLLDHLRAFLLELGAGFAFVESQYHLEVAGERELARRGCGLNKRCCGDVMTPTSRAGGADARP